MVAKCIIFHIIDISYLFRSIRLENFIYGYDQAIILKTQNESKFDKEHKLKYHYTCLSQRNISFSSNHHILDEMTAV